VEVDFSSPSERVSREFEQIISWGCKPQVIRCDNAQNTSVARFKTGLLSGVSAGSTFSQATPDKMPTWSVSTGRYDTSGCHNTFAKTWLRFKFKTLPPNGCCLTAMTDPIWPWVDLHQSSDWPWLPDVSTSATPAKGGGCLEQALFVPAKVGVFDVA
jgi:hypothetical protein